MNATNAVSPERIRGFVAEIERCEHQLAEYGADRTELFKSAKEAGLDVKVLRRVIAARKKPEQARQAEESLFDEYWLAIENGRTAEAAE